MNAIRLERCADRKAVAHYVIAPSKFES
jgi:hypothetical protein